MHKERCFYEEVGGFNKNNSCKLHKKCPENLRHYGGRVGTVGGATL